MRKIIQFKSKRVIISAVLSVVSILLCYIISGSLIIGLFFAAAFLAAGIFSMRSFTVKWYYFLPWIMLASFVTLFLSQFMQNEILFTLPIKRIVLGLICCLVPMLVLFLISMRPLFSAFLVAILILLLSTVNAYVYELRGSELCPADLLTIRTAMNVADQYTYTLTSPILYSWIIFGVFAVFSFGLPKICKEKGLLSRAIVAGATTVLCVVFIILNRGFPTQRFLHGGSYYNGFILNFTKEISETFVHKPSGYSTELITSISEKYSNRDETIINEYPDIIVIMDEAYSDLSIIGSEINTNIPITPFIDSLKTNTTYGYTLTSAYGGGTPNSEYEFLSGNSLLFLNGVIYQQYLREPSYSLVSYLKSIGYKSIAMHPYLSNGWRRDKVWPNLLFDKCMFIDEFPQKDLIRGFVSDREMFEVLIETFENEKASDEQPLFIFGVTMQNHSSYDYKGDDFQQTINLEGYSQNYPDVEQYLSLIHETDSAVESFLEYLKGQKRNIVVLFYGDHQPAVDEAFLTEVHGGQLDTLDENQLLQIVPFFIWTNFESNSEEISLTSLNYLSTKLLQKAGVALPNYNIFLNEVEDMIPAMNSKGYYSMESEGYRTLESAEGEEKEVLDRYWMLEYNSLFDLKNLDSQLFPLSIYE